VTGYLAIGGTMVLLMLLPALVVLAMLVVLAYA